jgi:hypothetical protein
MFWVHKNWSVLLRQRIFDWGMRDARAHPVLLTAGFSRLRSLRKAADSKQREPSRSDYSCP